MESSVLDKVRRFKASRPAAGGNKHMRGIFHNFVDGDNIVRLIGSFLEVKTHFVAPVQKRGERGACIMEAFQGDDKLPQVVNCWDWDLEKEQVRSKKTCPFCKLRAIALSVLRSNPTDEEKKYFESVMQTVGARRSVKWNIIDRNDPYVTMVDNGQEKRVLGLKIATIGMEAYNDIEGIFTQCEFDITDPEEGIDIKIHKGKNTTRTAYTAQACVQGKVLKVTPLTEEERALVPHDLKVVCGKMGDVGRFVDALHEDLRNLLDADINVPVEDEEVPAAAEEVVPEEAVAEEVPATPAPVASRVPAARPAAPAARPAAPAARPATPVAPAARPAAARPIAPQAKAPAPAARPAAPAARPAAPAARPTASAARPIAPVRPVQRPVVKQDPVEEAIAEGEGLGEGDEDQTQKKS